MADDSNTKLAQVAGTFSVIGVAIAYIQVSAWRNYIGWDAVQYMDIADQVTRGNWQELFRSYWSPLYPLIISVFKRLLPGLDELSIMAWVQMFCFVLTTLAFGFFAKNLLVVQKQITKDEQIGFKSLSKLQLTIGLYISYLYSTLAISEMSHRTPDVMATGICLFALALWLPMLVKEPSLPRAACTGTFLGLSIWAKNFNLCFAPLVALLIIISRKANHLSRNKLLTFSATLCIVVGALALPVSITAGRPTISDVPSIHRKWSQMFGHLKIVHGRGTNFLHPTRELTKDPLFYEFSTPFDVTYPPFYAPQYWYEGDEFRFSAEKYLAALQSKLISVFGIILGVVLLVTAVFAITAQRIPFSAKRLGKYAPGWMPALFGLGVLLFAADHHGRYYSSTLLILFSFYLACVQVPDQRTPRRGLAFGYTVLMAWMSCTFIAKTFVHAYFFSPQFAKVVQTIAKTDGPASPPDAPHLAITQQLLKLGIEKGDRIARIMRVEDGDLELYWAKGAGVKIVSESPDVDAFWKTSQEKRMIAYEKLKSLGVKAIVQDYSWPGKPYPTPKDPGWTVVPGTKTYILILK